MNFEITRAVSWEDPRYMLGNQYNSFLPKTVRETEAKIRPK